MEYKYPDNVQIVEPRPGVYVLGGKLKIERYDELNYVIKIKGIKNRLKLLPSNI